MSGKKQPIDPVAVLDDCAERMESIAVALRSLAACFPPASSKGGSDSDDEPPAKTTRSKAPKASELTQAALRGQLKALTDVHGAEAVTHVLSLVGVGRLPDVDPEHYEELAGHISDLIEGKTKLPGKKKAAAPEGPDYQDLEDRFRAVLKADTAKAKAIVTALKLKKFSEIDQENPKAMAKAEQLISDAEGTDEDDDMI